MTLGKGRRQGPSMRPSNMLPVTSREGPTFLPSGKPVMAKGALMAPAVAKCVPGLDATAA